MITRSKSVSKSIGDIRSRSNPDIKDVHMTFNLPRSNTIDRQLVKISSTDSAPSGNYAALSENDIYQLKTSALRKVNEIFKKADLKPLDLSVLSSIENHSLPAKRKWWEKVFKPKAKSVNIGTFLHYF